MAVSQSAKPKSVAASKQQQQQQQANPNANSKAKSQMHRRSRTGCYTCRLRRKKCDEGTPLCTACKHLGLSCEYKRPMWWSNNEARRQHKDDIKMIIKRKKLSEKASHSIQTSVGSPPGLSHSLPTSATFSDPLDRTRSASIDSQFAFNFNSPPDYSAYTPGMHHHQEFVFGMSPYEIDVKTERQMFVDDVPTIHESHISTFSTYQTPPPPGTVLPSYPGAGGEWTEQVYQERRESLSEEALNCNFFDFAHGPSMTSRDVNVELDDSDQRLLQHFIEYVLPTVFPILESNQHGSFGSDLVLPALQNNEGYLHSCLMVAAQHYKAAMNLQGEKVDADIMRHRQAAIWAFTEGLKKDENHQQILEATLSMIFFQTCVGRYDDTLPDIPWHQHFMAVRNLVERLGLPQPECEQHRPSPASFNMTQTAWIDILGNTMSGSAPAFAHFYRDKFISGSPSLGLRELMGCDDRVMFLVSEIACLEALKKEGMVDDMTLCSHVHTLGEQINLTEVGDCTPKMPFNANGSLSPKQLSKNITAAFRLAARIYLCSLVPGFSTTQASCIGLVEKLTNVLQFIPSGPSGFDRSLAWVYLIGGSVSRADSTFRQFFNDRIAQLGETANMGSFGGVVTLLHEVWQQMDQQQQPTPEAAAAGVVDAPYISWRDVMHMRGWDFLLI